MRGGLVPWAGKVGDALGIGADVYLEFIHIHVAQVNPPAQELRGVQTYVYLTCGNQGRIAGGFRAVDHQLLQRDLENPGLEAEVADFYAPAGEGLQAGDDPALQDPLEPPAAHDDQRSERQHQQVFHQGERDANRFGYFPARRPPSLKTKLEIRNSKLDNGHVIPAKAGVWEFSLSPERPVGRVSNFDFRVSTLPPATSHLERVKPHIGRGFQLFDPLIE